MNSFHSHNHQRGRYYYSHFLHEEHGVQRREVIANLWDPNWSLDLLLTQHLEAVGNELRDSIP